MKTVRKYWFIVFFVLTLSVPLYGRFLDAGIELKGVSKEMEPIRVSMKTVGDGTFQSYINSVWEIGFPGRKMLLRIRNQFLYSVLNVSPNTNVMIGKNKYLYEPSYIYNEIQAYAPSDEEYFYMLGDKLRKLKELLEVQGKELYVFITPSKAHFCREYIPNLIMKLDKEDLYSYTNYEKLLEELDKNKIVYYDSIRYLEDNPAELESPLFYRSGIHWNQTWGETCAGNFLQLINENSQYDLGTVIVEESICDEPISPATDLYSSLNLIIPAGEKWYASEMRVVNEGIDKPNVFLRGGSFMGQSLNALIRSGRFGDDVHFENNHIFTDSYSKLESISKFDAYDEIDIKPLLQNTDILILEVNEGAISNMSWGFIDYLLDHPDYLEYK